jgi:hypothetical protein
MSIITVENELNEEFTVESIDHLTVDFLTNYGFHNAGYTLVMDNPSYPDGYMEDIYVFGITGDDIADVLVHGDAFLYDPNDDTWTGMTAYELNVFLYGPQPPENLLLIALGFDSAILDWDASPSLDVDYYRLYLNDGSGYTLHTDNINDTTVIVNGLTPGITYDAVVRAVDTDGYEGNSSNEVEIPL